MAGLILGIWIITAVGGTFLWSFTTGVGRPESVARTSSLSPLLLFAHPLIGLTGMTVWIAYLYQGGDVLPWVAFALLVTGAVVGDVLLMRTLRPRRVFGATAQGDPVGNRRRAEDLMPRPVIVLHGVLAVVLMGLVLLYALGYQGGEDASYELF
jgi:hypothetical protein